jgi:hypothetical protein
MLVGAGARDNLGYSTRNFDSKPALTYANRQVRAGFVRGLSVFLPI